MVSLPELPVSAYPRPESQQNPQTSVLWSKAPVEGPERLALTDSDSLIAATPAAFLCATVMGAFAIRRKAQL